jgi:4-hydroxy-4-methyl-2-oxoglutarate aldolase
MTEKGADLVARLAKLDTCAVSDALDSLDMSGVALGLAGLSSQRKIAGRAVTVTLGAADGRAAHRHLGTAAVEAGGPGTVIVVQHNGRTDVAGWGGVLSLGAKTKGVEGVVIDGACRDVDEAREFDFPVFARVGVPRTARGRVIEYAWNDPVSVCDVTVAPGDYVLADGSGVVFVPADRADAVIAIAEKIVRKERLMAKAVRDGAPISAVMGADYEEMLKGPINDE